MFYWSKELLIDGCDFLHLINWWHILYCQTTAAPHHGNVEQLFHLPPCWCTEWTSYRANPVSSFMSLWGVSGILCFSILLLPSAAGLQQSANRMQHVINKHQCLIKENKSNSVIFHWLTASWMFNWIFYVCFPGVNQMRLRQSRTSVRDLQASLF